MLSRCIPTPTSCEYGVNAIPKKTTSPLTPFLQERQGCLVPVVASHTGKMTHGMYDAILARSWYEHTSTAIERRVNCWAIDHEGFTVVPKTGVGWLPSLDSNQGYLIQSQA